jgi:hypothetical protein
VFYKQGIISAYIIEFTRKVKQNNGKENCVSTQVLGVYSVPGKAEQDIHDGTASSKAFR